MDLRRSTIFWGYARTFTALLAVMVILGELQLFGQDSSLPIIDTELFSLSEGLSHRHVTSIVQDEEGFIWLGTHYGLNRFDGYDFEWFTEEEYGLQNNQVDFLFLDAQQKMWLIHTGSSYSWEVKTIDVFDPATHKAISFDEEFGEEAPFTPSEVLHMHQNERNELVFFTPDKIITYSDSFTVIPFAHYQKEQRYAVYWGKDESIWLYAHNLVLQNHRLFKIDPAGTILHTLDFEPSRIFFIYDSDSLGGACASVFYKNINDSFQTQHYLYIDSAGNVSPDPGVGNKLSRHNISQDFKGSILATIQGYSWTLSAENRFLLVPQEDTHPPIDLTDDYPELSNATKVFEDKAGHIWVSCQFGLYQFRLVQSKFQKYLYSSGARSHDNNFSIRGITVGQTDSSKHLWAMAEQQGELWHVDVNSKKEQLHTRIGDYRWAISPGKEGEAIFSGADGIQKINNSSGSLINQWPFDYINDSWGVTFIHEDKYGKIWFNNIYEGALLYFENGQQATFRNWAGPSDNLYLYQLIETETDTAWIVSNQGLLRIHLKTGETVERYWKNGIDQYHLPFDNIHHALPVQDGSFWLATATTGLIKWHPERGVLRRYTRVDGLPNNTIYAVYPDEIGNLWLPTDLGICVFNEATGQVRSYTTTDGISHNEFNRISHFKDQEGYLYFGTLNGITSFHPRDFVVDSSSYQAPLVITQFQQFDGEKGVLVDKTMELRATHQVTMQPGDPLLRLQFSLLSYEEMENVQYAYQIEGVDDSWTYQNENTLRLGRLPYGKHTLHIKAQAANGGGAKHQLNILIVSEKPFYATGWFIFLSLLLVMMSFFLIYRRREENLTEQAHQLEEIVTERTATIEQQKEELLSLDKLKTRFFANVSHELRTPLALILGPLESLLKHSSDREEKERTLLQLMYRNSQQLLKLVNEILDLSKLENRQLSTELAPIELGKFLQPILAQFASYAESNGIQFQVKNDSPADLRLLIDPDKVKSILENYLSNAFKFTSKGGLVAVEITTGNDQLSFVVRDTGIGIRKKDLDRVFDRFFQTRYAESAPQGGTGIGLSLAKELAELLGGGVWAESNWGNGSSFFCTLPLTLAAQDQVDTAPDVEEIVLLPPAPLSQGESTLSKNGRHILLVEDNGDLRNYLYSLLSETYQVTTAENGEAAWKKLSSAGVSGQMSFPDLIISDLMMPIMDGRELLEKVKGQDHFSQIPFIMLTARADLGSRLQALRIGVDDYLTKPFQEEELLARVENLLKHAANREELAGNSSSETATEKLAPSFSQKDLKWLEAFEQHVKKDIASELLTVTNLADAFAMSESTLLRQLKRLTGLSPKQYLQEVRLNLALDLLNQRMYNSVSEVAQQVGYSRVQSFSRSFKVRFGKSPSEAISG